MPKIYRLKASLPTFWVGDWCELSDSGKLHWLGSPDPATNEIERKKHWADDPIMYRKETIDAFNLLSEESGWFELVNDAEVKRFFPIQNCTYYYIDSTGTVQRRRYRNYDDKLRAKIGNCFISEEEARDVAERMKGLYIIGKVADSAMSNKDGRIQVNGKMENSKVAAEFCQVFMGIGANVPKNDEHSDDE